MSLYSDLNEVLTPYAKKIKDLDGRVDALESAPSGDGLTDAVKTALMNLVDHIVWDDDDPTGQTYITALHDALYPPVDILSISAVYTQSGVVYNTSSLDDLKSDLVVTALMSNQTSQIVSDYSLYGTLSIGTSTITVTYRGKSTTFSVLVSAEWDAEWSYTEGVLPETKGFTSVIPESGNPTASLNSLGLDLSMTGSADGFGYYYNRYDEIGVFEVVLSLTSSRTVCFVALTANGEDGVSVRAQYSSNYKAIYLTDGETITNMTKLCDTVQNNDYKITLIQNEGIAKVYINDVLVIDNVDNSNQYLANTTRMVLRNSGSSGETSCRLKSMKIRLGRIE